ncbi:hypothetical protein NDU88_005992 [Pleurodeles waltl]|uniref:Uncharacterized protein n=1 Tax=Pleurodeles waltl TaxID=8319 RepID=A0AAV7MBL3_PLEWA|nr:hypothetical protein NDU88_005992 [Pleurodeles waltl]
MRPPRFFLREENEVFAARSEAREKLFLARLSSVKLIRALERPTGRFENTSEVSREASARPDGLSSFAQSSGSDQEDPIPVGKRKRKYHNTQERGSSYRILSFDPESIIHPRSTEWLPCEEVAQYVQDHIRKGFDHEVQNILRSECPLPSLQGKVTETPDLDRNMATFM